MLERWRRHGLSHLVDGFWPHGNSVGYLYTEVRIGRNPLILNIGTFFACTKRRKSEVKMRVLRYARVLSVIVGFSFSGCATYSSKAIDNSLETPLGLVYFLPKRDVIVEVTVTDRSAKVGTPSEKAKGTDGAGKTPEALSDNPTKNPPGDATRTASQDSYVSDIVISQGASYPDLDRAYVLRHHHSPLSKNETTITVTNGLLSTGKSNFVSGVNDAARTIGGLVASGPAPVVESATPEAKPEGEKPCDVGKNRIAIPVASGTTKFCGVTIYIARLSSSGSAPKDVPLKGNANSAGLYYRLNLPYLVSAKSPSASGRLLNKSELVYSPSDSPTLFLPLVRGFFANAEADFGFNEGVPTQYKQTSEGEVVAALKLPADILAAYFAAIGNLFSAFKKNDAAESESLKTKLTLEMTKKKYDACVDALQKADQALLAALKCGE
jgi:hypothetical protein